MSENVNSTRSGSAYAYGLSTTACTTLKIAVVAPRPSASVKHRGEREPGFRAQLSKGERQILPQLVPPIAAGPRRVALAAQAHELGRDACLLNPAPRLRARLDGIDALVDQLLRSQLDVMIELLLHFLIDRHAPQQRSQSLANSHRYTPFVTASTRLTAAENSVQAAVWLASCCRPARVRR